MLMLRRTHERLMADKSNQIAYLNAIQEATSKANAAHIQRAQSAEALVATLVAKLADLADRNAPPPRITSVQQPKSITEADTNAAKKLRGVK